MRFKGICPKCGGNDILYVGGSNDYGGTINYINSSMFSAVSVKRYVCCGCGYSEEWIAQEDISRLEKKYPKLKKKSPKS